MYIVYQINKLFMGKNIYFYIFILYLIWDRENISMIKRGHEWKKFKCRFKQKCALHVWSRTYLS